SHLPGRHGHRRRLPGLGPVHPGPPHSQARRRLLLNRSQDATNSRCNAPARWFHLGLTLAAAPASGLLPKHKSGPHAASYASPEVLALRRDCVFTPPFTLASFVCLVAPLSGPAAACWARQAGGDRRLAWGEPSRSPPATGFRPVPAARPGRCAAARRP